MCRWLTYRGPAIHMDELIYKPQHSLIEQSMHADEAKMATNGDGFGVGWFAERDRPGTYHEILPAWNDANLRRTFVSVEFLPILTFIRQTAEPRQSVKIGKYIFFSAVSKGNQFPILVQVLNLRETEKCSPRSRSRSSTKGTGR